MIAGRLVYRTGRPDSLEREAEMKTMGFAALGGVALTGLAACGGGARYTERDQLVAEPTACAERRFDIYFAEGQDRLTEPARALIGMTAAQLEGCAIQRVRVTGLADASGRADANQALSERRAAAVAQAFEAAGWPAPAFEVEAVGAEGATTAEGAREPLRRRTEVIVEAASR